MTPHKGTRVTMSMRRRRSTQRSGRRNFGGDRFLYALLLIGGAGLVEIPLLFVLGAESAIDSVATIAATALGSAAAAREYRR
jgi:hypothetical protein